MAEKLVLNPVTGKLDLVLKEDAIDHNSLTNTHNLTTDISHDTISDVSVDDHHAQSHNAASHSDITVTGANIDASHVHTSSDGTNHAHVVANDTHVAGDGSDHADVATNTAASHAEAHTVASHSDTTATGAELETLTDNSMADTLHRHSELVASDGAPDPAVSVDADGIVSMPYQSGCRVHLSTTQSIPTGTWTKLAFVTENFDIQGEFDNAVNYRFTAKVAGYYQINLIVQISAVANTHVIYAGIHRNGALVSTSSSIASTTTTTDLIQEVSDILYLDVGDYIEGYIHQVSGANRIADAQYYYNCMSIMKIA